MKSVVVTGSTGLIGRQLVEDLKLRYVEVFTPGRHEYIPPADYIIHAAGYGQPAKFMAAPMETIQVHAFDPAWLIHRLKPGGRLLYLSSSEVYSGNPKHSYTESDIGSTTPSHPRACYIQAKMMGETICNVARQEGIDTVVARVALGYGPGIKADDERAIYAFIRQAITKNEIVLKDNGMALRTYCYITDMSEMLLNILFRGQENLYNVGGLETVPIVMLAKKIQSVTGCTVVVPPNQPDASAPMNVKLDIRRYCEEFGVPNFVTLYEGIRRTTEWLKSIL